MFYFFVLYFDVIFLLFNIAVDFVNYSVNLISQLASALLSGL